MVFGLSTAELAGLVMLSGLLPVFPAIWYVWELRDRPGVIRFMISMAAAGGWSLCAGLNPFIANADITITLFNLRNFAVSIAAIGWLLLATEYTFKRRAPIALFGVLILLPVVTQLLLWTNYTHELVYTLEIGVDQTGVVTFSPGPWWYVDTGYNYLLVLMGAGMWFGEWLTTEGDRRRQTGLFLLSTAILIGAAVLYTSRALHPIDPAPISFIIAGIFIAYALFKYQLFQVAPVAHETTIQEMDDAVVILNSEGGVAETNPAARDLFRTENSPAGKSMQEFFGTYPALVEELENAYDLQTEIVIRVDGGDRHFDLNVTPIEEGRDVRGRVIVLRDITSLKQREEELDLVKQVLTRVFRHNVRNDMTAIRGYGEVIEERTEGEIQEFAAEIVAKGDELIDQSEKARFIEDVIDADIGTVTTSLETVVDRALTEYRDRYPDVTFETDIPSDISIAAHPKIEVAIEQAVENAIEHSESRPTIRLAGEPDEAGETVTLYIEDDGPGIPETEIETILDEEETALKHGSGIGLWLMHWIVTRSGGDLVLENTGSGARVGMVLQQTSDAVQIIE
jgi:PAS domain S-box-containing protein